PPSSCSPVVLAGGAGAVSSRAVGRGPRRQGGVVPAAPVGAVVAVGSAAAVVAVRPAPAPAVAGAVVPGAAAGAEVAIQAGREGDGRSSGGRFAPPPVRVGVGVEVGVGVGVGAALGGTIHGAPPHRERERSGPASRVRPRGGVRPRGRFGFGRGGSVPSSPPAARRSTTDDRPHALLGRRPPRRCRLAVSLSLRFEPAADEGGWGETSKGRGADGPRRGAAIDGAGGGAKGWVVDRRRPVPPRRRRAGRAG
ncbi:hypothetical protein ACHAWF_000260, partial [Thalassiosira exigua]